MSEVAERDASAKPKRTAKYIGPGIISGASDNDPTTVASLAVIGSTTVYGLAWLVVLIIPMLAIVQSISAHVGTVARAGLEDCIRRAYGRPWALLALFAVLSVNVLTLAADLEGGATALFLLTHVHYRIWILPLAAGTAALLIFGTSNTTERFLKYIPLVFFTYAGAALLAKPDWLDVLRHSVIPTFNFSTPYVQGAIALLGTTLTSYAYVWETIEVSERKTPIRRLGLVQADAVFGMIFAGISFWFIVVGTGATLGVHHKTVETATDAAQALTPIAGPWASTLFGIGLLGSALIAIPVLAGTSAYVMAEMFQWRRSLDATFAHARRFYIALLASLALATAVAYLGIPPIKLLFISSIAGGIGTPVTLVFMMLIARHHAIVGEHPLGRTLTIGGWTVTAVVVSAAAIFLFQTIRGG